MYIECTTLDEFDDITLTNDNNTKENYIVKFLRNFCYFPFDPDNIDKLNFNQDLAIKYLTQKAIPKDSTYDALIMAEASTEGLNILTKNEQDMISIRKEGEKSDNTYRRQRIKTVNFTELSNLKNYKTINDIPSALCIEDIFLESREIDLKKISESDDFNKIRFDEFEKFYKVEKPTNQSEKTK